MHLTGKMTFFGELIGQLETHTTFETFWSNKKTNIGIFYRPYFGKSLNPSMIYPTLQLFAIFTLNKRTKPIRTEKIKWYSKGKTMVPLTWKLSTCSCQKLNVDFDPCILST